MTFGDYVALEPTEISFGHPQKATGQEAEHLAAMAPSYGTRLSAVRDAKNATGHFPVIIYAPSFSQVPWENADLCEYIASFGYTVLAVPAMGIGPESTHDVAGTNEQARDISFLIDYAKSLPEADLSEVAVVGYSWGGLANLFAASRDNRIRALVALDGSMRYFPGIVKDAGDVHPEKMAIPLLYFKAQHSLEDQDELEAKFHDPGPNVLNEWGPGDLVAVSMLGLVHPEFSSRAQRNEEIWKNEMANLQEADYGREDGMIGYRWMARYTREFLDSYLKHDAAATQFLKRKPFENGVSSHVMVVTFKSQRAAASAQQVQPPSVQPDSDYQIRDRVMIPMRDGGVISAVVVKRKGTAARLPALLTVDIYTDPPAQLARAKDAADHGYVGVIADTRGKRLSPDPIVPYEHEASDGYDVIDWIARQPWSDGQVGMRGGSYQGFTAWAATKRLHPALKTMVVSAAAIPGDGLPMANNIFLNANYSWAFYVTDNKLLDDKTNNDSARWQRMQEKWFASGEPYRKIDQIDGQPNLLLQRWLQHPAYDKFWQDMVPYKQDFAQINIPVLTVTGYYDDAQQSALDFVREHAQYNAQVEDYVVVGPYDHLGSHRTEKAKVLRGYTVDPAAQFSTPELEYQWMDYVMRGGPKPALLKDKINFEVMGANEWHHASSLAQMTQQQVPFYFSSAKDEGHYSLVPQKADKRAAVTETVDFADRSKLNGTHYYPRPIIEAKLEDDGPVTEMVYASRPFAKSQTISGAFTGELDVTLNKKDADLAVAVFEQMADGRLFHLGYWLGRASYAGHPEKRVLLTPSRSVRIPFATNVVSCVMAPGSKLVVLLDVNKNPYAQINYGTGNDVSDESIKDAGVPLVVRWHSDSFIKMPLSVDGH